MHLEFQQIFINTTTIVRTWQAGTRTSISLFICRYIDIPFESKQAGEDFYKKDPEKVWWNEAARFGAIKLQIENPALIYSLKYWANIMLQCSAESCPLKLASFFYFLDLTGYVFFSHFKLLKDAPYFDSISLRITIKLITRL